MSMSYFHAATNFLVERDLIDTRGGIFESVGPKMLKCPAPKGPQFAKISKMNGV